MLNNLFHAFPRETYLQHPTWAQFRGARLKAQALRDPVDAEQRHTIRLHPRRKQIHPTLPTVVLISGHEKPTLAHTHFFLVLSGRLFNQDCM